MFVMSLLVAFSIWLVHNMARTYTLPVQIQVEAQSNIDGHSSKSDNFVNIEARCNLAGYRYTRIMGNLKNKKKSVSTIFFDPADFTYLGDDKFSISSTVLSKYAEELFGNEVKLESFMKDSYVFVFPSEYHKKIPVYPVGSLTFKDQYTLVGDIEVSPDSIVIYGEPIYLENIDRVYTDQISYFDLDAYVSGSVNLNIPQGVRSSAENVDYSIEVSRYVEIKRKFNVGVKNNPPGSIISVYPSTAEVTFRCIFPMKGDPTSRMSLNVDGDEFLRSINGRCVARFSDIPNEIISYSVEPEIFECVENLR